MNDETNKFHTLHDFRLLITPDHECSYLENHQAATVFVDPQAKIKTRSYSLFSELGFRRSGDHVYRPHCSLCNKCKSLRIKVDAFILSRSQKRLLKKNTTTTLTWAGAQFNEEHFELYGRYMSSRHEGSSMESDDPDHYMRMMKASWSETRLAEFRINTKLIGVAVTDWLVDGFSAVYTFFDPDYSLLSPGTYSILQQVAEAKKYNKRYLYLGYWIKDCKKMSYKNRFSALQIFNGHAWENFITTE